jgi:hypothetical protein
MVWPSMLRRSCQTGRMNDLAGRLHKAGTELLGLRGQLVAGEPWPLSAAYGTEPEADWGPRELLAHVNEMLPYWTGQLEGVLAADRPAAGTAGPPRFGRIATDANRLDRIATDRHRPVGALLDGIDGGLRSASTFVERLTPEDLDRIGGHPTRGDFRVADAIERFVVSHLEEHVAQLREILSRRSA